MGWVMIGAWCCGKGRSPGSTSAGAHGHPAGAGRRRRTSRQ